MTQTEPNRSRLLVLDTHTLIWMVNKSVRLGAATSKALDEASFEDQLAVSAITPWEIARICGRGLKAGNRCRNPTVKSWDRLRRACR